MNRRRFLMWISTLALPTAEAADAGSFSVIQVPSSPASAGPTFAQIPIGGGGYVTGLDVATDGTMVARVDVWGAFINNTKDLVNWTPLITRSSVPSSMFGFSGGDSGGTYVDYGSGLGGGVWEVRIAPSNSSVLYMAWGAGSKGLTMLVSTNKGQTWALMGNFPTLTYQNGGYQNDANALQKFLQKKMAIDPNNPDVVYIATPVNGLYVTNNGTSGSINAAIPSPRSLAFHRECLGTASAPSHSIPHRASSEGRRNISSSVLTGRVITRRPTGDQAGPPLGPGDRRLGWTASFPPEYTSQQTGTPFIHITTALLLAQELGPTKETATRAF